VLFRSGTYVVWVLDTNEWVGAAVRDVRVGDSTRTYDVSFDPLRTVVGTVLYDTVPQVDAPVGILSSGCETVTNGEGRFRFDGVPVGPARFVAVSPPHWNRTERRDTLELDVGSAAQGDSLVLRLQE
jgi:hypothetical protein